jgi:hypothetical protein
MRIYTVLRFYNLQSCSVLETKSQICLTEEYRNSENETFECEVWLVNNKTMFTAPDLEH